MCRVPATVCLLDSKVSYSGHLDIAIKTLILPGGGIIWPENLSECYKTVNMVNLKILHSAASIENDPKRHLVGVGLSFMV